MTTHLPPPIQLNNGQNNIQYMESFKYLGSTITPDLKEDTNNKIQILGVDVKIQTSIP